MSTAPVPTLGSSFDVLGMGTADRCRNWGGRQGGMSTAPVPTPESGFDVLGMGTADRCRTWGGRQGDAYRPRSLHLGRVSTDKLDRRDVGGYKVYIPILS